MKLLSILLPLILAIILIVVVLDSIGDNAYIHNPAKNEKTIQGVAVPLGLRVNGAIPAVDERLNLYNAFDRARIPLAAKIESPMGARNGAFCYNAQGFLVDNLKRGGLHLGDDLNGIGGQNTDLNDPIYAAADGLVVYVGKPSLGWGQVIILAHRLPDGQVFQTFYSHLKTVLAAEGAFLKRGDVLGTCGNAGGRYFAHLHYEMRLSDGVVIGGGYGTKAGEKVDPSVFTSEYGQ